MSNDFPLVLSMTQFQNYRRCRKLFEYSAIRNLSPVKISTPAELGSDAHALLAYAAEHGGQLPFEWPGSMDMYNVVKEYIERKGLPPVSDVLSVERGFYAEIAPNVFIRGTFDIMYNEGFVVVQDYKTFDRAPSLDPERNNQGKEYVLIAATALKLKVPNVIFRWEYIRRELGRMLAGKTKGTKVYTEWADDERYFRHDYIVSATEEETLRKELYDCALDIQETIERQRFYRTPLTGTSPFTCGSCFFVDICSAELHNGSLSEQDIALLTAPNEPSERVDALTILDDPRVKWYVASGIAAPKAIVEVYSPIGLQKVRAKADELSGHLTDDGKIAVEASL